MRTGTNGVNGMSAASGGGGRLRRDTSFHHMNGMVSANDSSDFSVGGDGPLATDHGGQCTALTCSVHDHIHAWYRYTIGMNIAH